MKFKIIRLKKIWKNIFGVLPQLQDKNMPYKSSYEGRGVIEQNGFTIFYFSPSSMTWGTCTLLEVLSCAETYHNSD